VIISTLSSRNVWRKELAAMGVEEPLCTLESRDINNWTPGARWYFVHFDIVLAWQTKLQASPKPCCVIVDEAHNAKNGRTQRGKGVYAVTVPATRKIILTGTPVENNPADLWHLLTMSTGPYTWGSPLDFRQRYCGAWHDGYGYHDGEPSHMDELLQRIEPFYLRRTATDVGLNLPPLTRQLHTVELSHTLQCEHDEVLGRQTVQELVSAIQLGHMKDHVLETLSRLRSVTSSGKIHATVEYVQNLQDQGEGVIVFTWERASAQAIADHIKGSFCITGDDPQSERERVVDLFQATPGSVLIATLGAMRESVTLHTARIVIMHDWHWVLTHLLQAEARVWRTGQRRACQSIWMMAKGSVDELIAKALYTKAHAMKAVGIDEGTRALEQLGIGQIVRDAEEQRVGRMLEGWL
jgi:SNF2 family DNA or RNA helicase